MDFALSSEQLMIRESVERFAAERGGDVDRWTQLAELGWLGLGLPEAVGGFGGPVERMIVMEAFGRGLVGEPYATGAVAAGTILAAAGRDDLVERLVSGSERFAVAYEGSAAAERRGDGYVLHGAKRRVVTPAIPVTALVSAEMAEGVALFAVAPNAAGLDVRIRPAEDGQHVADLDFAGVALDAAALVAAPADGAAVLECGLDHASGALGAEAVGIMTVMLETTLRYVKERRQFGVAIGTFQALQHRLAEMFVELELARSMSYVATMALERDDPVERRRGISAARVQIARSGRFVGQNALQLHGAIAMAEEYVLGRYFKRLTTLERLFGDADAHLTRYRAASAVGR